MRIAGDWINAPSLQTVMRTLLSGGHQAFLVGGCVRNAILGQPVADIDIATDARPERVMALAEANGLKCVPTGIDHGTITLVVQGVPHEITTFRRDVETDGRRAVVAFSDGLEEDASRRDFTMNALYADFAGEVIDPLDGLADLQARRVRFVGKAEARIREDYLRILRFFRFHAWYGDLEAPLDGEGLAACAANSAGLETLSRERIGSEMRKLLAAPNPVPSIVAMQTSDILARVMPGTDGQALARLVQLEGAIPQDWIRRLSALGGADPTRSLRLSREESRRWQSLQGGLGSPAGPAELGYRLGQRMAADVVLLRAGLAAMPLPANWEEEIERGAAARLPVDASDLMPGFSGPALGKRLREIEDLWIASGFVLSREQLLA